MITPRSEDALHRAQLYGLLTAIIDNHVLAHSLSFKGGTCATMLGFLDRFSVDLDFDISPEADKAAVRAELLKIFREHGLKIKDKSARVLQYFLLYDTPRENQRNTLKLDILTAAASSNLYKAQNLVEIRRVFRCQTIETMFANKLVALEDRYQKNTTIAGRDVYDIHHFFKSGYGYEAAIITERTGLQPLAFFKKLEVFIEGHITIPKLQQDLNALLPPERFQKEVKHLKVETLLFIRAEIGRLESVPASS